MKGPKRRRKETEASSATSDGDVARTSFPLSLLRRTSFISVALILVAVAFNAYYLLPELTVSVPSNNDDAFHYLSVQRGSEALSDGENLTDHWSPAIDLGAPRFLFYQHLPHVAVILLNRLLLQQVGLLTLFNLIRYLLLVGLPLTVYWTMRQLGFSTRAGAFAAAASTLFSANFRYGFEYDSFIWRGWGLYTQIWAMHLSFITLALLYRLVNRGSGYALTIAACSALVLSHLLYTAMMVPTGLVILCVGLNRTNALARLKRLGVAAGATTAITAYFWIPFLMSGRYVGLSPYEESWHFDSFGVRTIMGWLVEGELFDYGRLPILTLLLAVGTVCALVARTRQAVLAVALFVVWLSLYFGREIWGPLVDRLPGGDMLLFHRFLGGVDLAAIILMGLGGDWVWRAVARLPQLPQLSRLVWPPRVPERWRFAAAGAVLLALLIPALLERRDFYELNTSWMEQTRDAVDADADARTILDTIAKQPPGRTYAGLRDNWGKSLDFGIPFNSIRFYDLLTFYGVPALSPPYQSLTLNSSLQYHFDERNHDHYELFNVRYVIAPSAQPMPEFLTVIKKTNRYTLYRAQTNGSSEFAAATQEQTATSKFDLFFQNRDWLLSDAPARRKFIRWDYPAHSSAPPQAVSPGCKDSGAVNYERVLQSGQVDLLVECKQAATLVLKMTYHPNWHVAVDGVERDTFMVSPSFIGVDVPAGLHHIDAEYRPPPWRTYLLIAGLLAMPLVALGEWRRKDVARLGRRYGSALRERLGRRPG